MTRLVLGCGAVVDTLIGGISILGGGEISWLTSALLGGLTVISPIAFYFVATTTRAFDMPAVLSDDLTQ